MSSNGPPGQADGYAGEPHLVERTVGSLATQKNSTGMHPIQFKQGMHEKS